MLVSQKPLRLLDVCWQFISFLFTNGYPLQNQGKQLTWKLLLTDLLKTPKIKYRRFPLMILMPVL